VSVSPRILQLDLLREMFSAKYCLTHSLTHARYAGWHVEWRQRYSTPVCFGSASEQSLRYGGGSCAALLQFDARC